MGFWQRFSRLFPWSRRATLASPGWLVAGAPTAAGVVVNEETALRQTVVYRCVRLLAETVSTLPVHVYRETAAGPVRARTHALYELLHDQANPLMTSAEMFEVKMTSLLLRGEAYTHVRRGFDGEVRELVPLHPDRVEVRVAPGGRELLYLIDGGAQVLHTGEVWHVKGLTRDGIRGLTPIAYNREAIGLAMAAEAHGAHVFAQAAQPSGVLVHPGKLKPETKQKLAESWQRAYSGAGVGKVAVLEEGVEWKQLSMNAQDAQYIETRKFQVGEIARIFGVPPHKVGDLGRATWANIEHQNIEFVQDTLRAWLKKFEATARRDLLLPSERRDHYVEFSLEGLLRGDTLSRYQAYEIAIRAGVMSPNEARRLENRAPYDGGDEFIRPLNMTTVPAPAGPAPVSQPLIEGPGDDDEEA